MLDERLLINLVKENPILYNSSHKNYMDVGMKLSVWNDIGAQLNTDGERCKQRWNNIRDNYRKSLKKLMQQKSMKPYRFAWQLEFLKQFIDEREPKCIPNLSVADNDKPDYDDESRSQPSHETFKEEKTCEEDSAPGCDVVISVPTAQSAPIRKKKIVRESPSTVLMKYLLEKKSALGTSTQGQTTVNLEHPVDAFLFALAPSLKSLPPHLLTRAKSEIFACVQKYEMKIQASKENIATLMDNTDLEASMDGEEGDLSHESSILGTTEEKTPIGESPVTISATTLSSSQPPLKRQKISSPVPSHNQLLRSACELLSSCKQSEETTDEYEHLAKLWTFKLKSLVPTQKKLAERAINEVLFEADLRTLHRNSVQINHDEGRAPITAPLSSDLFAAGSNTTLGSQSEVTKPSLSSEPFSN